MMPCFVVLVNVGVTYFVLERFSSAMKVQFINTGGRDRCKEICRTLKKSLLKVVNSIQVWYNS